MALEETGPYTPLLIASEFFDGIFDDGGSRPTFLALLSSCVFCHILAHSRTTG
jgi:hypothetical protein